MIKNETSRYLFWDKYLDDIILKIENLISNKKDIYCDFHIHSNYSIDSNQSLKEIIDRANRLNLDVISITDHDSVAVYDELYWYLKNHNLEKPIIIPGIEFTIENKEYGSQFHILQLMINPKSKDIINDIKHQQKARWNRSYLQFERIKSNKALQYFKENKIGKLTSSLMLDTCESSYQRGPHLLNLNSRSRSNCGGCKACIHNYKKFYDDTVIKDQMGLYTRGDIEQFFDNKKIDVQKLVQIAVVTGLFKGEDNVVEHMKLVN